MKAISLWEPWASLIMTGAKQYETRSWKPGIREDILICASKVGLLKSVLRQTIDQKKFREALKPLLYHKYCQKIAGFPQIPFQYLNFGMAVCVVNLETVFNTVDAVNNGMISDDEFAFGDYSPNRYAWKLTNLRQIEKFEVKGKQGFFEVDDSLIKYL